MPFISIIVPNYNHAKYLRQRLDSICNQSFQDYEMIILDDSSEDDSKEIIASFSDNPKISHIIFNNKNSGSTFNQWEKGLHLAQGDYIWIAESDDFCDSTLLEALVKNIQHNKNVIISYCQSFKVDVNGTKIETWPIHEEAINPMAFVDDFVIDGKDFIHQFLQYENVIPNASAVIFKKDTYFNVGGVDKNIQYCADWHLWLKLSLEGNIAYSAKPLNFFRIHSDSVIATAQKKRKGLFFFKYDIIMLEKIYSYLTTHYPNSSLIVDIKKRIKNYCYKETWYLTKKRKISRAIAYFKKAITI